MRKLLLFLPLALLALCNTQPANAQPTDTSAINYINAVGDMPVYFQDAVDKFIKAEKANGTWSGMQMCLLFSPTQDMNKALIDAVTCTQVATYAYSTVPPSPLFVSNQVTPGNDGLIFDKSGTAYIKTGFIYPSGNLNNSCWALISPQDEPSGTAGYNAGALQSSTQSMVFNKRDASNNCYADMYGSTVGTGRARQTSADGAAGVYIANRQSSTNFKLWKNGTTIASTTSSQGSLPTIQTYLNAYNSSGTASGRRNKPIAAYCVYGGSLTDAQVAQETLNWQQFMSDVYRNNSYTEQVVFDGNSHMVAWYSKMFRQLQYLSAGVRTGIDWHDVAVSGQTTTQMITKAPTVTDPLYNSALSKNILIAWECTNDISAGASATTAYNNFRNYCLARKAVGWTVVVMPPMCRGYTGTGSTYKMLATDSVSAAIKANWSTFADAICDYPSSNYFIPRSDYASDAAYVTAVNALCNNTTYFVDKTHLTEFGYSEWANQLATVLDSL